MFPLFYYFLVFVLGTGAPSASAVIGITGATIGSSSIAYATMCFNFGKALFSIPMVAAIIMDFLNSDDNLAIVTKFLMTGLPTQQTKNKVENVLSNECAKDFNPLCQKLFNDPNAYNCSEVISKETLPLKLTQLYQRAAKYYENLSPEKVRQLNEAIVKCANTSGILSTDEIKNSKNVLNLLVTIDDFVRKQIRIHYEVESTTFSFLAQMITYAKYFPINNRLDLVLKPLIVRLDQLWNQHNPVVRKKYCCNLYSQSQSDSKDNTQKATQQVTQVTRSTDCSYQIENVIAREVNSAIQALLTTQDIPTTSSDSSTNTSELELIPDSILPQDGKNSKNKIGDKYKVMKDLLQKDSNRKRSQSTTLKPELLDCALDRNQDLISEKKDPETDNNLSSSSRISRSVRPATFPFDAYTGPL